MFFFWNLVNFDPQRLRARRGFWHIETVPRCYMSSGRLIAWLIIYLPNPSLLLPHLPPSLTFTAKSKKWEDIFFHFYLYKLLKTSTSDKVIQPFSPISNFERDDVYIFLALNIDGRVNSLKPRSHLIIGPHDFCETLRTQDESISSKICHCGHTYATVLRLVKRSYDWWCDQDLHVPMIVQDLACDWLRPRIVKRSVVAEALSFICIYAMMSR